MGKLNYRPTGSKLLGQELRRLRGSRTMQQIADLSRSEAFAGRIRSIAEPTLSQIENGISMPTIESLHTLAVVYRVSAQRLLNIVAEERLATSTDLPATEEAAERAFLTCLEQGRFYEALELSIHGARIAPNAARRAAWSVYRARTLQPLGMQDEAILALIAAIDEPTLSAMQRSAALRDLAEAHLRTGNITAATMAARAAAEVMPDDAPALQRALLLQTKIQVVLHSVDWGRPVAEAELRSVQRMAAECHELDPESGRSLLYEYYAATATSFLGNHAVALKDLNRVAGRAARAGLPMYALPAYIEIGAIHRRRGRPAEAIAALERAADIASDVADVDASFEVHATLAELHAADASRAAFHRRKAERHFPLVSARTPAVAAFERSIGGAP